MNRFIVTEPSKCIACRTCEIACVVAHTGFDGVGGMSPENFAPRVKLIRGPKLSTTVTCRHCEDAPCANACPNGAIVYRDNSVQVLQDRCVGCKTCVIACPFGAMDVVTVPAIKRYGGAMQSHGVKAEAHKCDLCAGRPNGPACIEVCPTKAMRVFDRAEMDLTLRKRQEQAALDLLPSAQI